VSSKVLRIASGMIAGYGAVAVAILYTFFSVRVALHYLGKEEFGLWSLAMQVMGYLMLLELGLPETSAVSWPTTRKMPPVLATRRSCQPGSIFFGRRECWS
jgi:hypothetical protein